MKKLTYLFAIIGVMTLGSCAGDHKEHEDQTEEARKEAQDEIDALMKKAEEASADTSVKDTSYSHTEH